jgi:hypothetical protein
MLGERPGATRHPIEMVISDNSSDTVTATYISDNKIVRNKEVVKCTMKSADVISLDFKQLSYGMLIVTFNLKTSVMHVSYMEGRGSPYEGDIKKK